MTPISTFRARLPCPCCGVVGARTVALQTASRASELVEVRSATALPEGPQFGLVSDCAACWKRRADRIATARDRLRATGELSSLGPGREDAWLGVPLSRSEPDYECAFSSALMKSAQVEPFLATPQLRRIDVAALVRRAPKRQPELIEA